MVTAGEQKIFAGWGNLLVDEKGGPSSLIFVS